MTTPVPTAAPSTTTTTTGPEDRSRLPNRPSPVTPHFSLAPRSVTATTTRADRCTSELTSLPAAAPTTAARPGRGPTLGTTPPLTPHAWARPRPVPTRRLA